MQNGENLNPPFETVEIWSTTLANHYVSALETEEKASDPRNNLMQLRQLR